MVLGVPSGTRRSQAGRWRRNGSIDDLRLDPRSVAGVDLLVRERELERGRAAKQPSSTVKAR